MNKVDQLKNQIRELESQLERIQDACSHPPDAVTKEHRASLGNYDPTADCYWTHFHCELCDLHWTEEGSK